MRASSIVVDVARTIAYNPTANFPPVLGFRSLLV